jgi:NRAMP (natural resistance-associated macrophage protein)-like metal ion transporter
MNPTNLWGRAKRYWKVLGPGLVTGAADDDPSGITTYSQAGAGYGFQLLWLALFTLPLMGIVQEMCARIGLVSGRGLAENIRLHYSRSVLYLCVGLLLIANTFNIAADIGAMAKGVQLLAPMISFPLLVSVFVTLSIALEVFLSYETYAGYLKYLALVLLVYVAVGLMINLDWREVIMHTIVPSMTFSRDQIFLICAILGTTISPYLFFWQSSQEVEEDIERGKTTVHAREGASSTDITDMRIDVWSGMTISNIVMFFIIAVCGATLFSHGITTISTAADAASALRPIAGEWAYLLFALGMIGTGLLSVPVLAGSSAYALAEALHWREGLYRKPTQAYGFYGVVVFSMLIALVLNFVGIDPIKALIYAAVGNGIVAPVMLILIVLLSSRDDVMGTWKNTRLVATLGWVLVGIMSIASVATIVSLFY